MAAATRITVWNPATRSSVPTASPGAKPATSGIAATASSCPVRATRVVDARCDAGVLVVDRTERGGGERRDGQREAEAEHDHAREHVGPVAAGGVDPREQQGGHGDERRPHRHRDPRPDALGELPGRADSRSMATVIGTVAAPACSGL
jgi:hypothetical protein